MRTNLATFKAMQIYLHVFDADRISPDPVRKIGVQIITL